MNRRRTALLSYSRPAVVAALRSMGYETLRVPSFGGNINNPEAAHADMQALVLQEGDIFLIRGNDEFNNGLLSYLNDNMPAYSDNSDSAEENKRYHHYSQYYNEKPPANSWGRRRIFYTSETIGEFRYPYCVKLNTAIVGRFAFANFKYCDRILTERLEQLGYETVSVKQGYAKCSVCVAADDAVITADDGIFRAAKSKGIDALLISPGNIGLCEGYGGFIGGASFLLDGSTLAFTGDITAHTDYMRIRDFCRSHSVEIVSLTDEPLFDIGGAVFI